MLTSRRHEACVWNSGRFMRYRCNQEDSVNSICISAVLSYCSSSDEGIMGVRIYRINAEYMHSTYTNFLCIYQCQSGGQADPQDSDRNIFLSEILPQGTTSLSESLTKHWRNIISDMHIFVRNHPPRALLPCQNPLAKPWGNSISGTHFPFVRLPHPAPLGMGVGCFVRILGLAHPPSFRLTLMGALELISQFSSIYMPP
jgi:hypothetical protein